MMEGRFYIPVAKLPDDDYHQKCELVYEQSFMMKELRDAIIRTA